MTQLTDRFGRPLTMERGERPEMREIAAVALADRYSSYPSRGLTPERLANILREAADGDILRQCELFEDMEEKDAHLYSVLTTRKNAVLGLDWEITPASEDKRDQAVAGFVRDVLTEILDDALLDILDAIGKGFSGHEIMWEIVERKAVIAELRRVPQQCFTFGLERREFRVLTAENQAMGEPLTNNKFVVHLYRAKSGHPSRAGLLRVVSWMYLFKNYDLKDWITFCEIYGMPLRVGKYEPTASKEDKQALIQALRQLGTDAAGIIPTSALIEFVEASKSGGSAQVYERLAAYCNAEMSKAILGQTLTTEIGDKGSYSASQTHQQVRQDLLEADCKALSMTLKRDLIRPLVWFNFGLDIPLPGIKFRYEPPEDLKQTADTYKVLAESGLPIPVRHVYARFGIPEPQAGEAVMAPPAAASPLAMKAPGLWPGFRPIRLAAAGGNRPTMRAANSAADALADATLARALPVIEQDILEPLRELIESAASLEEIAAALPALYPGLDLSRLEELTQQTLFVADLNGRLSEHG